MHVKITKLFFNAYKLEMMQFWKNPLNLEYYISWNVIFKIYIW